MLAFFLPERWPLSRQFDWPFSPEYPLPHTVENINIKSTISAY